MNMIICTTFFILYLIRNIKTILSLILKLEGDFPRDFILYRMPPLIADQDLITKPLVL